MLMLFARRLVFQYVPGILGNNNNSECSVQPGNVRTPFKCIWRWLVEPVCMITQCTQVQPHPSPESNQSDSGQVRLPKPAINYTHSKLWLILVQLQVIVHFPLVIPFSSNSHSDTGSVCCSHPFILLSIHHISIYPPMHLPTHPSTNPGFN